MVEYLFCLSWEIGIDPFVNIHYFLLDIYDEGRFTVSQNNQILPSVIFMGKQYSMKNQESKEKSTPQTDEEIKSEKIIAAKKKFSCQSKSYPPMEWWEFIG